MKSAHTLKRMGVLLLVLALGLFVFRAILMKGEEDLGVDGPAQEGTATQPEEPSASEEIPEEPPEPPYVSPIDFEALWEQNSDIRAWLSLPALEIDDPVVCKEGDNGYYLRRDLDGNYFYPGTYFIEDYNTFDFSDPVTIIYGHNLKNKRFGEMQENYSKEAFFKENNTFTVYTPDAEYQYRIFAAVPYDNRHILYYNNFYSFPVLEKFLEEIYGTRSLIANFDADIQIEEGDKITILSTCRDGDNDGRYLLLGVWKNIKK